MRIFKALLTSILIASTANASFLIPDAGVTRQKLAVGAVAKANYVTYSSTNSLGSTDDVVNLNGASFTFTLTTAVGVKGRIVTLHHGGTSISQVYSLATTSGQTIGGIASGSYALYTNGEDLVIVSDNANWQILSHYAQTNWSSPATTTITTSGGAQVKGTIITDAIKWRRKNQYAEVEIVYSQSVAGTQGAGTYGYRVTLPGSLVADNSEAPANTNTDGTAAQFGMLQGHIDGNIGTTGVQNFWPVMYDSTTFRLVGNTGLTSQTTWGINNSFASANMKLSGRFLVPISGWQP